MSSPVSSFETMVNDFITATATLLDQFAQALITAAPYIAGTLLAVGLGYLAFRFLRRTPIVNRIIGWFTGA
jgi:F0F1-type ATP synthase assembly protein I